MTLSSPNLKSSAQRLSPNATTPGEVRALSLDGAASAAELPPSLAGGDAYDAVAAARRARERRLEDAGGAGGSGAGLASVALTIGGGVARNASRPRARTSRARGYEGNVSFACPDNATVVEAACDGLPNVIEVVCPGVETACAAWNATAAAWRSSCEAVGGADGATTCACDVDASGAAAPTDFSTEDEATDAGSVYFKNLTEPPDLSRALIMIYALLALLGACVAAHAYGRRLDARDAAAARGVGGRRGNFLTGWTSAPFYGWYTLYSASVPRPFRAWCCGFEILVFMYALAFETNLLFPDVEEECAGKLNPETCASLKTVLRGKFKGTHVESAPLCQWIPCAEACVMEEPGEDEMSPMSAARRPERGPARRDDGRARRPVCKIFAYLAENYLVAPVPLALRWRRGSASPAGAPAARAASSPEDEPPIPTLKIDWHETGAPEASPGTLASSAGPESAVADDELLRKLRAAAHALLEGGPPDARESQAPIPEGGAADGDATGFAVSCSVQCDGAACVAPAGAAHTCLSSTLDDAFAVPSMTAACLFGLDRLEDEVSRARVAEARPAAAKEAAPVDDGDLVVPEMGDDSSKTTVRDCAEMLAPTLARAVVARSRELRRAAAAATSRTTARRLGELDAHLLERWGFNGSRQVFIANVERVVVKRLGRAARWHAELEAADDARAKERAAVAYLREEMLSKKERTVMTTIAERLQGELEAPEEPPGAAPYIAAWAGVLCVVLYCFYYLLTTGSQFGRKKTRLWLEAVTFSLVLYFVFIKPIVVLLISVIMPSFVASSVDKARSPLDHPRYPFETPLPRAPSSTSSAGTPSSPARASRTMSRPRRPARERADGLTDARRRDPRRGDPRTSGTAVVLALIALLFGLHEDLQDTLIEEVFTFLPLASGFVAERTPGLESAGRTSAQPSDEAPETLRPDVAGEDEKSPEDAVALVLFDDGGDGDRVEAVRPDDDEAAAERPDDAASDGECLDEEIFLDADVQRADEAGAADAEARGAEAAARDDHEAGTRRRSDGGRGLRPRAKPEDAPVPSYSDAAYAAVFGAAAAARDDHDAGTRGRPPGEALAAAERDPGRGPEPEWEPVEEPESEQEPEARPPRDAPRPVRRQG
ncbi:hypothetical protein JL721_1925 [Aureococcus anophagefferens]|nr:hypothetical protein JL721_1925 [Aureococcus anophagefferens]